MSMTILLWRLTIIFKYEVHLHLNFIDYFLFHLLLDTQTYQP